MSSKKLKENNIYNIVKNDEFELLNEKLNQANEYIEKLEDELKKYIQNNDSNNQNVNQPKYDKKLLEKIKLLEKQLEESESRYRICFKEKKKLIIDLDIKSKENISLDRKLKEILDDSVRLQSLSTKSSSRLNQKSIKTNNLDKEIDKDISLLQKQLSQANDTINELKNQIINMNKSNNIDLSGHSNMLSKITYLRNEMSKLKHQLILKENEYNQLYINKENLTKYIQEIESKIINNDSNNHTILNSEEYKNLLHERDTLLDYIQNDLKKSSDLYKQIEILQNENQLLVNEKTNYQEKYNYIENSYNNEINKFNELNNEIVNNELKYNEMNKRNKQLQYDYDNIIKQIERTKLENEELTNMQLQLFIKIREKDETIELLNTELKQIKSNLYENTLLIPILKNENDNLKTNLSNKQDECMKLNELVSQLQPQNHSNESQIMKLINENNKVQILFDQLVIDYNAIKPLDIANHNLTKELEKLSNDTIDNKIDKFNDSNINNLWIVLPIIHSFNQLLYNQIKNLLTSTQTQTNTINHLTTQCKALSNEINKYKDNNEIMMKLSNDNDNIIHEYKIENEKLKSYKNLVNQIKLILQSFPGGLSVLLSQSQLSTYGNVTNSYIEIDQIPDHILPDIISKAIIYNTNAINNLNDLKSDKDKLVNELNILRIDNRELQNGNNKYNHIVNDLKNEKKILMDKEMKLTNDLITATELIEKQNALTITLEAKLESLKRERQVKEAQMISLQQREDSIKQNLLNILHQYIYLLGVNNITNIITDSTPINELIKYINEIIKVIVSNSNNNTSNYSNKLNYNSKTSTIFSPKPELRNNNKSLNNNLDSKQISFADLMIDNNSSINIDYDRDNNNNHYDSPTKDIHEKLRKAQQILAAMKENN